MKSAMVKKTKAELIWVTTWPVANGYSVAAIWMPAASRLCEQRVSSGNIATPGRVSRAALGKGVEENEMKKKCMMKRFLTP